MAGVMSRDVRENGDRGLEAVTRSEERPGSRPVAGNEEGNCAGRGHNACRGSGARNRGRFQEGRKCHVGQSGPGEVVRWASAPARESSVCTRAPGQRGRQFSGGRAALTGGGRIAAVEEPGAGRLAAARS